MTALFKGQSTHIKNLYATDEARLLQALINMVKYCDLNTSRNGGKSPYLYVQQTMMFHKTLIIKNSFL